MTKKNKGGGRGRIVLVALAVVLGAVYVYGRGELGWFGAAETTELAGAAVRRGPLSIAVVERGNLEAKDAVSLRCEVEGRTTVLSLIPEGTIVEPGQIVAELDVASLLERKVQQEDSVLNARAVHTKAVANLEIQKTENESLIARAEQQVSFSEQDLRKFIEGDKPQQEQKADEDIILAQEELANAEEQYNWSEELAERGFLTRTELEKDELSFKRAGILLEQATRAKSMLLEFEHVKQHQQFIGDLEEARRELKKVNLQAEAQLVDQETAVLTSEARLRLEEKELQKVNDQIEKTTLRAPIAGMVVYGREEGGRWSGREPVSEGGEVRERQEVVKIPRSGGMIAKASVHESVLKQVQVGQEVILRVDAIPSREFRGRVEFVAVLPDQNSWFANPNLRLYKVEISIADEDSQMRPGMSCNVEILVDRIEDTLHVPVQCVVHSGGRNVCFVADGAEVEEREVKIGPHNSKWVSIEAGLSEGEVVLMSPPPGYQLDAERPSIEAARERPSSDAGSADRPAGAGRPAGAARPGGGGERSQGGRSREAGGGSGAEGARPRGGGQGDSGAARGRRGSDGE